MLEIRDLHVETKDKKILQGLNLKVLKGEIHAIMGPNGAGKSTLAKILAGDPTYAVTEGVVLFEGKNILEMEIEERAHCGIFMGFQYPIEIPGVTNLQFLLTALNAHKKAKGEEPLSEEQFLPLLQEKMALLQIREEFKERSLNAGYSGGEKKRNEILQMGVLEPKLAILDETDSGLDIDAMRTVASGIHRLFSQERALILITHYQRLLEYLQPHFVHILVDGKIVASGGYELAKELEERGYNGRRALP